VNDDIAHTRRGGTPTLSRRPVRERADQIPYVDHVIHKTEKAHLVRSKSELVIANLPYRMGHGLEKYEQPMELKEGVRPIHPNFSFTDAAGDRIVWEHLVCCL
jgi:hypothetical protein